MSQRVIIGNRGENVKDEGRALLDKVTEKKEGGQRERPVPLAGRGSRWRRGTVRIVL